MLLYLLTNTRPNIAFAVSQVARFNHNPKKSHATAIKMIIQYLARTSDKGTIAKPTGSLLIDCYVDADFASLYGKDPDASRSSPKSRLGYVITLGGVPLVWKSQLIQEICLSTTFAEYNSLSQALRFVLPIRSLILELLEPRAARDPSDDTCKSLRGQQWSLLVGEDSPPHGPHQILPCEISPLLGCP
jgi:hypothetical protein